MLLTDIDIDFVMACRTFIVDCFIIQRKQNDTEDFSTKVFNEPNAMNCQLRILVFMQGCSPLKWGFR